MQLAGFEDTDVDNTELRAERRRLDEIQMRERSVEVRAILSRPEKRKFDQVVEDFRTVTIEQLLNNERVNRVSSLSEKRLCSGAFDWS